MDRVTLEEGLVAELWRFPVKSMLGEALPSLAIDARGVEGDRLYAVCDAEGKLGSGKNTQRMRRMEGLFGFAAARADGATKPQVTTPDGLVLDVGDPHLDEELSRRFRANLVLRAVAREADACLGVYAEVLAPGRITRGDRVRKLSR